MQSLPTTLTLETLNSLVSTLETMPSAEVSRRELVVTVTACKKSTGERVKVFSAISEDGQIWAAMAVPGLIRTA